MAGESNEGEAGFFDFVKGLGENGLPSFGKPYLDTYYRQPPTCDENLAISFFVEMMNRFSLPKLADGKVHHLDAACGPTVHHVLPAALHADILWLADYLPDNREEVEKWWKKHDGAHDWGQYTALSLRLLGKGQTPAEVAAHEALTRSKISGVLHCNFLEREIFSPKREFSAIGCFYGTEEVGTTKEAWGRIVENVSRSLVPGGVLFLAILGDTEAYRVGDKTLPCARLRKADVEGFFRAKSELFDMKDAVIREEQLIGQEGDGLHTVILVAIRKR